MPYQDQYFGTADRLQFPLSNAEDYLGTITFKAKKENNQNAAQSLQRLVFQNDLAQAEEFLFSQPVVSSFEGKQSTVVQSNRTSYFDKGSVTLFMPTNLQFTDGIEYSNVDLGALGAAGAAAIKSGKTGMQIISDAVGGAVPSYESTIDALKTGLTSDAAQLAALRTVGKLGDNVRGAIETATGITLNPNRRSTLRGVAIRTFRFTFKLIPSDRSEAAEIKKIINFFRTNMYPEDIPAGGIAVGYRFPSKFDISMMYDGKPVAQKILPCFLQTFDTNYNPNSMSFHEDGNFSEIDISMTFIEERTLRNTDVEQGY